MLAEVLDRLPPIVVDERTMTVIDGVHRLEASRRMGRTEIRAVLFSGDETDALVLAIQANVRHGKPLSRGERQAAACVLLRRSPDRSDRWVGETCGLSHSTVARLRQLSEVADRGPRTGRDGRRRPVAPGAGHAAVANVLAGEPAASVRQAAGAAGVALSTAYRVAAELPGAAEVGPGWPGGRPLAEGDQPHDRPEEPPAFVPRPGPDVPGYGEPGPRARPGVPGPGQMASWLARTTVAADDLHLYLEAVPRGRIYEVVDECRRRSRTWSEIADALEKQARARRRPPSG